jgi:hypothetical protein
MAWLWLTDLSQEQTDQLLIYYGFPGATTFGEYLRTLGARRYDGTEKPALVELRRQLTARGW